MKEKLAKFCCRLKSPALWVSLAALIVFCVKTFSGIDISQTLDGLLNVLLPVLAAFGILNNPTDRNCFMIKATVYSFHTSVSHATISTATTALAIRVVLGVLMSGRILYIRNATTAISR